MRCGWRGPAWSGTARGRAGARSSTADPGAAEQRLHCGRGGDFIGGEARGGDAAGIDVRLPFAPRLDVAFGCLFDRVDDVGEGWRLHGAMVPLVEGPAK